MSGEGAILTLQKATVRCMIWHCRLAGFVSKGTIAVHLLSINFVAGITQDHEQVTAEVPTVRFEAGCVIL